MTPPLSQLPFVIARHDSAEAISVGYNKDCHASPTMTHSLCHCVADLVSPPLSLRGTTVPKQSRWGNRDCHASPTMTHSLCHCVADLVSPPLSLQGTTVPKQSRWGNRDCHASPTMTPPLSHCGADLVSPLCRCEAQQCRSNLGEDK